MTEAFIPLSSTFSHFKGKPYTGQGIDCHFSHLGQILTAKSGDLGLSTEINVLNKPLIGEIEGFFEDNQRR